MIYEALSPVGEPSSEALDEVTPLADLNDKTVCEVSNGGYMGEISFPIIRELLTKRYPGVNIIPYTEFPLHRTAGTTEEILHRVEATLTIAKQKSCDVMITGNGG
jgi:hypothetical protein